MNLTAKDRNFLICVLLSLAILSVYGQVKHQDFVNYDDIDYVTGNLQVQHGLTASGVVWAFTTFPPVWMWHPLTWLSYMLDYQLFGLNPGADKLVNVTFHIGSTLLLFLVFNQMTRAPWRSAFVAAVFALHPLRVESVAWVSERKDVLSTFFWMLSMWAYVRYVENRTARRYLLVVICFTLGLMAKSMLVTLPCVLLLLDVWPLKRVMLDKSEEARRCISRLIWEKMPLFVLSAAACVLTHWAQSSGPVRAVKSIPLILSASNAVVSYVRYIEKLFWPANLAVFYPHPGVWAFSHVAIAIVVLVGVTMLVIRVARIYPFLAVGWFWYLGTLVPVIGLVQVGDQSIADRYTYVPTIGLLIMIAWGVPEILPKRRGVEVALRVAAACVIAALMVVSWQQVRVWQNSITLFEHALAVTDGNYIAHNNLGAALRENGKLADAAGQFQQAVEVWPEFPEANKSLADLLARSGQFEDAVRHYNQALRKRPNWPEAESNLGFALAQQGQLTEAVTHFTRALELDPTSEITDVNLGLAYMKLKNPDLALSQFSRALSLNPADAMAHYLMGVVLQEQGHRGEAIGHFEEALRLNSNFGEARAALDKLNQ